MPPKHWTTQRLDFRPVTLADAEQIFFTYAGDPVATHFMPFHTQRMLGEAIVFANRCEKSWEDGSAFPWAIRLRADGRFVGVIELRITPPKADFGYILGSAFWGQGYASEAAKALADWVMTQPGIYRLLATCHPENKASARVLQKAGLVEEAALDNWETRPQRDEAAGPSLVFARVRKAENGGR